MLSPRFRATLAFAAVTAAISIVGFFEQFTIFPPYDDEGYYLVSLADYQRGGVLYDEVDSQYGPLHSELYGGLLPALGVSLSHDHGRLLALAAWIGTSLLLGLATWRLTGLLLIALPAELLAFKILALGVFEPMHPANPLTLLLAASVAAAVFYAGSARLPLVLGLLVGAMLMLKVNVGAFAAIALAYALTLHLLTAALFAATPLLLMAGKLGEGWVRVYAALVTLYALALVVATLRRNGSGSRGLTRAAGAAAAVVLVCSAIVLLEGTSLSGLANGVVLDARRQADKLTIPLSLPAGAWICGLAALAGAIFCRRAQARRIGGLARIFAGVAIWASAGGFGFMTRALGFGSAFVVAGALAWVATIPPPGSDLDPGLRLARVWIVALATLQLLHAYPVAGSQIAWSSFLLVVPGALCISDGVRALERRDDRRPSVAATLLLSVALGAVLATAVVRPGRIHGKNYRSGQSLGLPGARLLRLPPHVVARYRRLVASIRKLCPTTFYSEPAFGSLYLFTGKLPPTTKNVNAWMFIYDEGRQQRIVDELRKIDDLCVIRNDAQTAEWAMGREVPALPLVRYIDEEFVTGRTIGDYEIRTRRSQPR